MIVLVFSLINFCEFFDFLLLIGIKISSVIISLLIEPKNSERFEIYLMISYCRLVYGGWMCWGEVAIFFFFFGCEHIVFDFDFFWWVCVSFWICWAIVFVIFLNLYFFWIYILLNVFCFTYVFCFVLYLLI